MYLVLAFISKNVRLLVSRFYFRGTIFKIINDYVLRDSRIRFKIKIYQQL